MKSILGQMLVRTTLLDLSLKLNITLKVKFQEIQAVGNGEMYILICIKTVYSRRLGLVSWPIEN